MKTALVSLALLIAVTTGGWILWRSHTGARSASQARRILYYQDSMHPWIKSDAPGKCTVCGMDLTPIYEGQAGFGGDNVVVLTSNSVTVLNVQTEAVKRQSVVRILRVAGLLDANETKKAIVTAPTAGRIEETAIDYAGVEVRKGQPLLTFYSPELTQQKYRYLVRAQRATDQHDPAGGLASQKGEADPYYSDLVAPLTGTVIERNVSRGQYVSEGERLFTIADASILWFRFDVYEQQLPWLRLGQKVMVSLPALPGDTFEAVISFIDPMLDPATRTVKVRADLANPLVELEGARQRRFKFGMYAEGVVRAEVADRLAVPRAAVLCPGSIACVYVDKGDGAYERRQIKLGRQGDDLCEVRAGLEEGDRVVTSGNVLLDAQAQFAQKGESNDSAEPVADPATAKVPDVAPPPHSNGPTVASPSPLTGADALPRPAGAGSGAAPSAHQDDSGTVDSQPAGESASSTVLAPQTQTAALPVPAAHAVAGPLTPSGGRGRPHTQAGSPDPIPYGGRRMLEGPMFVRMAELRNAELAEKRAAKACITNTAAAAVAQVTDNATSPAMVHSITPAVQPPASQP